MSENINKKTSDQGKPDSKTGAISKATSASERTKSFLGDTAENIEDGAKLVREKATEITDKLKKGLTHAYDTGAKVVDELSQRAQEYSEKYRVESEIKKLKNEREMLTVQLGQSFFKHRLTGEKFVETFFNIGKTIDNLNRIEMIDKEIIKTSKQYDHEKE